MAYTFPPNEMEQIKTPMNKTHTGNPIVTQAKVKATLRRKLINFMAKT